MQLHLASDVLTVKVSIPQSAFVSYRVKTNTILQKPSVKKLHFVGEPHTSIGFAVGAHKRNPEIAMGGRADLLLLLDARWRPGGCLHNTLRRPFVLVHGGALTVLCLPRVVHLKAAVELVTTCLGWDIAFRYFIYHYWSLIRSYGVRFIAR